MAAIEAPSLVMKTETHCHSNPLNSESFELRVLVKRTSSVYVHHTLAVSHNARDEEIMTALREVHQLAKRRLMDLGQLLLMRRIAIGTARILNVINPSNLRNITYHTRLCPQISRTNNPKSSTSPTTRGTISSPRHSANLLSSVETPTSTNFCRSTTHSP